MLSCTFIFISLVRVKVLCLADDLKHPKHVACEDFSLRYRLPKRETGTHFNVISTISYLSCIIGIKGMWLSRKHSKVSLSIFVKRMNALDINIQRHGILITPTKV